MKEKEFRSPGRYIQGQDLLKSLHRFTEELGKNCLVILSKGGMLRLKDVLDENEKNAAGMTFYRIAFGGECCMQEIDRLVAESRKMNCDTIIGIGGGKLLDTAKAVAHFAGVPVIVVPTNASSDAPCSALSVVYHPDGTLDQLLLLKRNPDLVLVDSTVISKAPAQLFSSGLGDALATYYEMHECWNTDSDNFFGKKITLAAKAIATQCYETLMADGRKAYSAVKKGLCTRAVENVIEANILLSGIGFESGGVCAAHPVNNGLAELPATHSFQHGHKVAFALIVQLVLSNAPMEEIEELLSFLHDVDLPVTLAELGITNVTEKDLQLIAAIANSDPSIHRLTKTVDETAIINAVLAADALGKEFLQK